MKNNNDNNDDDDDDLYIYRAHLFTLSYYLFMELDNQNVI